MSITPSDRAAIASIIAEHVTPALRTLGERMSHHSSRIERVLIDVEASAKARAEDTMAMREQVQALLLGVADLKAVFADYDSAMDGKLSELKSAIDAKAAAVKDPMADADDPALDQSINDAINDIRDMKGTVGSRMAALSPKADAAAAVAGNIPLTGDQASGAVSAAGAAGASPVSGIANPPSADPKAPPIDPQKVASGESLQSQNIGAAADATGALPDAAAGAVASGDRSDAKTPGASGVAGSATT